MKSQVQDLARNLNDIYFHTTVTCALYKGTEKVDVLDRRDFNEDIVSSIDGALNFLEKLAVFTGVPKKGGYVLTEKGQEYLNNNK